MPASRCSFAAGVACFLSAFPSAALAQSTGATRTLTLPEAFRLAEERSPLVRRVTAERRSVEAREVGASQYLPANPFVSAYIGKRREAVPGAGNAEGRSYGLHVEQAVEIAGQRGTRREVVRREVAVAMTREGLARLETRARVQSAFVGAMLGRKLVEAAQRRAELGSRLAESVAVRLEKGAASSIDLRLAESERGQATQVVLAAELLADESRLGLRHVIGLPMEEPFDLPPDLEAPPENHRSIEELLAEAVTHRAELKALEQNRSTMDAELVRLRREAIPSPLLFVDLQRDLPGQMYVGGGMGIALPLFRRNQGERAVVRAEQERIDVERDLVLRDVRLEVARAHRSVEGLEAQLQVMTTQVLPAVEASVGLLTEGWKAGKFDFFRVIQASREAAESRRLYLSILGELWQANIELGRAIGRI